VDFIFHDDGHVEFKPVRRRKSIQDLIGILPTPRRQVTLEEMQRAIEEGAVARVLRHRQQDDEA
jgi:hypothetical protein